MADLIKKIKIKKQDGTFTDYIPIGAEAQNISTNDGDSVQLKLNKKPYYYDTVADMKADTKLKAGDMAITLGYYEINDGGGAEYKIVDTSAGLVDDGGSYHELDNGLWANLIIKNGIGNVKQLGAYGDSIHDDTVAIQNALDIFSIIQIPNGIYMITATTGLFPRSNTSVEMESGAILRAFPNNSSNYNLLRIYEITNFSISGGIIELDNQTHVERTEFGNCIRILRNASYITIKNMICRYGCGDGVCVASGSHIKLANNIFSNNWRHGITIGNIEDFYSFNDKCISNEFCGVDIEPDQTLVSLKNIVFENLYTENNTLAPGLQMWLMNQTDINNNISINIINHHDKGSKNNLRIAKPPMLKGKIMITNPFYENALNSGIVGDFLYNSTCKVHILNPIVINANSALVATDTSDGTSSIQISNSKANHYPDSPLGGVYIINPYLTECVTTRGYSANIYICNENYPEIGVEDIKIENPIYLDTAKISLRNTTTSIISDILWATRQDQDNDMSVSGRNSRKLTTNANWTSQHIVTIRDNLLPQYPIILRCENATYPLRFKFPDSRETIYGFGNSPIISAVAPTFDIAIGGEVVITKKTSDMSEWYFSINNADLVTQVQ